MNTIKLVEGCTMRRLRRIDRAAVLNIEADSFQVSTLEYQFQDYFEDDHYGYVVERNKQVLAYMLYERKDDHVYLSEIAVAPIARGRGIGTFLLTWLKRRLKLHRLKRIELDVNNGNEKAIALYKSLGFVRDLQLSGSGMHTLVWYADSNAKRGKAA